MQADTAGQDWPLAFLAALGIDSDDGPVRHVEELPASAGRVVDWPDWVDPRIRSAYAAHRIDRPWAHQAAAATLAHSGRSVVLATGTATGKSLGYQLPVLDALLRERRATALYLSPTKALANDQLRTIQELRLDPGGREGFRASTFDGDTPVEERDWVREHCRWMLSNPDMLSHSLLPGHRHWHMFLRHLRYVVIDECHVYRGVFGSHVAHVLRRLRRVCGRYGTEPTFVLASATVGDPAVAATRLTGIDCASVSTDDAPRGARTFVLWEPPLTGLTTDHGAPVRRSANAEAARLMADLVVADRRTIAFVRSRRAAETVTLSAQRHLAEAGATALGDQVAAYRSGYLPEDRRALERDLTTGTLRAAAATTALELGIDIAGLDAVLVAGFPGTLASLWQQVGRAGRRRTASLAVLIARDDPLDTYLVHHPQAVFGRPVEASVTDPTNPYVLAPQLSCAAYELPITDAEVTSLFGGPAALAVLGALAETGVIRHRPDGWYWTGRERPTADLRGAGVQVALVENETGRLIGTVESASAGSSVHRGAVYLHRGETWVVDALDLAEHAAILRRDDPDFTTYAQEDHDIRLLEVLRSRTFGPVRLAFVSVEVNSQVVSYQRRRLRTGEVIDTHPLDLPPALLETKAVLWTIEPSTLAGWGPVDVIGLLLPGALHAAEHASIGLLPLLATCDRWDLGGVSTAHHPDTGLPSVFVYDGHPGGAGFAERGYEQAEVWLRATAEAIRSCECATGCPSCVQSPKCGNGNQPLDKARAILVLDALVAALAAGETG